MPKSLTYRELAARIAKMNDRQQDSPVTYVNLDAPPGTPAIFNALTLTHSGDKSMAGQLVSANLRYNAPFLHDAE